MRQDGRVTVYYDDGDRELLNLSGDNWTFENRNMSTSASKTVSDHSSVSSVVGNESNDFMLMDEHFGNKSFMKNQPQGFERYNFNMAYDAGEISFL